MQEPHFAGVIQPVVDQVRAEGRPSGGDRRPGCRHDPGDQGETGAPDPARGVSYDPGGLSPSPAGEPPGGWAEPHPWWREESANANACCCTAKPVRAEDCQAPLQPCG